ncbi:hypothetical protein K501DRAFT_269376 [Backusella circina FSU 941]|nr:hypothetical protein K501DRAFT_269376 [Backusella circina FSU 941]
MGKKAKIKRKRRERVKKQKATDKEKGKAPQNRNYSRHTSTHDTLAAVVLSLKSYTSKHGNEERNGLIVIAFGTAEFGNLRGNDIAPAKKTKVALIRHVKERSKKVLVFLLLVDEHITSQICSKYNKLTEHEKNTTDYGVYPVLICSSCNTQWNRDHMSRINVGAVFLCMANDKNERPEAFAKTSTERKGNKKN